MDYRRELLKGNTDAILLFLLSESPRYGYQMVKEIESRSDGYFQFKEGTIYPALHRLEKDGMVTSWWQQAPNGQPRKYYAVTEKGAALLRHKLAEWRNFSRAVSMLLMSEA